MKPLMLLYFNSFSLLLVLGVNFLYGSGAFGLPTVGEISNQYPTLITPAGYAFSIWGLIYFLLIGFVIYQWYSYRKGKVEDSLLPSGWWFTLSNFFNILWIIFWVNNMIFFSTILIFALLICLIQLVIRLRIEVWDAPLRLIGLVWWPISIYMGWIVLASVLNVSVLLVSLDWGAWGIPHEYWAVGITIVAVTIYFLMTILRNMRETALVGSWGFLAIAVNTANESNTVFWTSVVSAIILFLLMIHHAFQNQHFLPFMKWKRGEV